MPQTASLLDVIQPRWIARVIRSLNSHWEWYYVLAFAAQTAFVSTHVEYRGLYTILPFIAAASVSVIMAMTFISTASEAGWAIGIRIYVWLAMSWMLDIFLLTHEGARTAAEVWTINGVWMQQHPAEWTILFFVLIPIGPALFLWTRWSRTQPNPAERRDYGFRIARYLTLWGMQKIGAIGGLIFAVWVLWVMLSDEGNAYAHAHAMFSFSCFMGGVIVELAFYLLYEYLGKRWEDKML